MTPAHKKSLDAELASRASKGQFPVTVAEIERRLAALGYRLDRDNDCRSFARYMTGERAGESYPCCTTNVREADTGRSFAHYESRRDSNFRALQELRASGDLFAVTPDGYILEI